MTLSRTAVRYVMALIVTVTWAATYLADILVPTYNPPAAINSIFSLVLATMFRGLEWPTPR